jgi:PAS domain S-box-containing protein
LLSKNVGKRGNDIPLLEGAKRAVRGSQHNKAELLRELKVLRKRVAKLRQAEKALRESEEKWRSLVNNAPGIVMTVNRDGTIRFINQTVPGITGRETIGKRIYDYISPKHHDTVRKDLERIFQTGQGNNHEISGVGHQGVLSWYEAKLGPIRQDGRIVASSIVTRDITDRKRAEEALRESEERCRSLTDDVLNSSKVGIFILDNNFNIVWVNQALERYFGLRREEIIGKDKRQLIRRRIKDIFEDPESFVEKVFATYDNNTYIENFECHVLADGKRQDRWLEHWSRPIHSGLFAGGRIEHYTDITRRKKAEETLKTYREQMIRAEHLASLGMLSAAAAHELTQPLTVIRLSVENSLAELEKVSRPGTVIEDLKDVLAEVSHVTSIVDRFRNFTRESPEKVVGELDLKAIAERIVELLEESAWRAKVTVHIEGMDNLPPVHSNREDLEQLFFALVDNAIQAADGSKNRRLNISGAVEDECIELRFSDDCGGIAPENLEKIFEPFFTTKPVGQGTGLGLCVVQRIVSQAGGKVRVKSKAGKGSAFFITLPIGGGGGLTE